MPCSTSLGFRFWADIIAELNTRVAVETQIGLFVPPCWAVGVSGDGFGDGVRVVSVELETDGAIGSGGKSASGRTYRKRTVAEERHRRRAYGSR